MCGHQYVHRPSEMEMEDMLPEPPPGPTAQLMPNLTGLSFHLTF